MVVCGLGTVGARVLEILAERGVAVVGVEQDDDAPGVQTAHRLRIPVIIGDSANEETLRSAGVQRCQAVLAITNGDITNLESAMVVRQLNPDARITMRMFDHDLAQRVERQLGLGHSRSVSMLVAGDRRRGREPAQSGDRSGRSAGAAAHRGLGRAELRRGRQAPRRPGRNRRSAGARPAGGQQVGLVPGVRQDAPAGHPDRCPCGTRSGLARLLLATRAPHRSEPSERMDP